MQNKKYTWKPDITLEITGKEFEVLYNNLLTAVNEPVSFTTMLKTMDAFAVLQNKFNQYVTDGKITEQQDTEEEVVHTEGEI